MTLAARIVALAELTLKDPRRATRTLLAEAVPLQARLSGLVLVAVLSALIASLQVPDASAQANPLIALMTASPLRAALIQWVILALAVGMIHVLGRAFGGRGTLEDALLIMVWVQFLLLGLQALQVLSDAILPALAEVIGLVSIGLSLWLITSMVAELHGFSSRGAVFIGVIGGSFLMGLALTILVLIVLGPEALLPDA